MRLTCSLVAVALASTLFLPASMGAAAPPQPTGTQKSGTSRPVPERALTKMVHQGRGELKLSIRKTVQDSTDILNVNWPYVAGGRHSTTLYSLGPCKPSLPPDRFMKLMKFKPTGLLLTGSMDVVPSVEMGSRYPVNELGVDLTLVVTDVSPAYFTLADESHRWNGSVTYGAFKDGSGELWVYEECVGDYFTSTSKFIGLHHREMVAPTHKQIQAMLDFYVGEEDPAPGASNEDGPCPPKFKADYSVGVSSFVKTGVQIKRGDKITISASGLVSFGLFAGQGGPEGIQFGTNYNYFSDVPHGCLLARVRHSLEEDEDRWSAVGKGLTVTAQKDGTLELDVNDTDPGNNTGQFRVEISVCKAH